MTVQYEALSQENQASLESVRRVLESEHQAQQEVRRIAGIAQMHESVGKLKQSMLEMKDKQIK